MRKYLKLSNVLLNANNINKISVNPNNYIIHTQAYYKNLYGEYTPQDISFKICQHNNPIDYNNVTKWIGQNNINIK